MSAVLVCLNQTTSHDPLEWQNTWILPPAGYGRVLSGKMKKGDLWLNHRILNTRREAPKGVDLRQLPPLWMPWRGLKRGRASLSNQVCAYTCIVRPGAISEPPCERCRTQPRYHGERYCDYCAVIICHEGRRR